MDPLAHTLVGAALAETGLRRLSPRATATLIIGANLPDLDAVFRFGGQDTALLLRRGVTHGIVALAVLPWLLAGAMVLYHRLRSRGRAEPGDARFRTLLALGYLAVLSHPLLDWLNNYGVRLFAPFSGRWFYGDTLFIVDPWMWLLAGGAVVLARTRSRAAAAGWAVLGAATTALILLTGVAPPWAMAVWCLAVAAIVAARILGGPDLPARTVARASLAVLGLYVVAMFAGSRLAESQVRAWAEARGWTVEEVIANPVAAQPLHRDVVVSTKDRFHFLELGWLEEPAIGPSDPDMPRLPDRDPVVTAALAAGEVRGFTTWMRLPSARVERLADGYRVHLYDVRYFRGEPQGIGDAVVELNDRLEPR